MILAKFYAPSLGEFALIATIAVVTASLAAGIAWLVLLLRKKP